MRASFENETSTDNTEAFDVTITTNFNENVFVID